MVQKTQDSGFSLIEEEKKRMLEAAKQKAPRKEEKEEEEREKVVKETVKEITPSVVQRQVKAEAPTSKLTNKMVEENQEKAINKIANPQAPKSSSVSDQFKEALTFFAPTMIGALGGALIEGTEGAVYGADAGTTLGDSFRNFQLKKAELAQKAQPDALAVQRLQVSKDNLELRKKEVAEQAKRTTNLGEERSLRREERDLERAVQFKQDFGKRAEVKKFLENLNDIEDIKTLAIEGKKLPQATQSKIARSVSGEVGVLTESDIARAQINPDIKSTIHRKVKLWVDGELPQKDIDELLKVANAIRAKKQERLRESAIGFAKSRDKHIKDKGVRKRFLEDILSENGLQKAQESMGSLVDKARKSSGRERLELLRKIKAMKEQ